MQLTSCLMAVMICAAANAEPHGDSGRPQTGVAKIRSEAAALQPIVQGAVARSFLAAAVQLPAIEDRLIFRDAGRKNYFSQLQASRLAKEVRGTLEEVPIDEEFYYTTKYGTPVAYVRVLELYGQEVKGPLTGRRVLDFGFGTIGHLRMMAACGADVVGIEIDPLLHALYSNPGDQGRVASRGGVDGRVQLVHGRYPKIASAVGGGYDLITSKNTLKNGFFHPERPVPKERLMDLGVETREFARLMYAALNPGGVLIIYNICPAPSKPGEPYKHWADGRCPLPRAELTSAGFAIVQYDAIDNAATRARAKALQWDRGEYGMDLENDLFAWYTVAVKPR